MDVNVKVSEARAHHDRALEIMNSPDQDRWGIYKAQCHNLCGILDLLDVLQYLARVQKPWRDWPNPE